MSRRGFLLLVAALVMAILVLGAIDLSGWFKKRGRRADDASDQTDAGVATVTTAGRVLGESGPVRPGGDGRAVRGREDQRTAEHEPLSSPTGEIRPGPSRPPVSVDSAGQTVPGQAASQTVAGEADSRAARHPAPAAGPGTPGPIATSPGVAAPGAANVPSGESEKEKESEAGLDATSDRTPPTLSQLRFEPGVVEGGAATTLTIQATDNLAGVKSVRGEIQSPSGKALLPLYPQESHGGDSFTYVLSIPPAAETGVWFVKWLYLTDAADNSALIQVTSATTAPPGGTFSVSSSESDSTPPDVFEVSFARDVIENEDRNVIRIEVHDDLSGVSAVAGACQSPSRSALLSFRCALNEETGLWEGDILIPENADCGVWSVQQLSAKDKAGNTTQLRAESPILAHATFAVAPRDDCDSSAPTLEGFVLSQTTVPGDAATEILITATVHDVGSGVASVTGWFEGPVSEGGQVPKNHFTCTADPEHPEAPWTGKVLVPQFAAKGKWKARVIRLEDKALNFREYTPADAVLSTAVFEVR